MFQHPKQVQIEEFDYELPNDRIAKYPVEPKDSSQLLVYNNSNISSYTFKDLHHHLPENTLLVMNNTKVVEARLLFQKSTGSIIEIFCLEPDDRYPNLVMAMMEKGKVFWKCLIGGAKKWKEPSLSLHFNYQEKQIELVAKKLQQLPDYFLIEFSWNNTDLSFAEVLHGAGIIPLPPYLKRETEDGDKINYQTVYAEKDGSVAAPTAGLHFTDQVFQHLTTKNIQHSFVTLHVGAGTFMPVKSKTLAEHTMHAEYIDVDLNFIEQIIHNKYSNIVAVGTTSLRTLESLYWMGVKVIFDTSIESEEDIMVKQWDAYELPQDISLLESFKALVNWMKQKQLQKLVTQTQLLIAPGYTLRTVNAIITNFHQPQSTLLLLIYAFVGNAWKTIYDYALKHDYRFLSYGDSSLLWKH